jgi:hypothetical protein
MKLEYNACNLPFHQIISEKIEQLNGKLVWGSCHWSLLQAPVTIPVTGGAIHSWDTQLCLLQGFSHSKGHVLTLPADTGHWCVGPAGERHSVPWLACWLLSTHE